MTDMGKAEGTSISECQEAGIETYTLTVEFPDGYTNTIVSSKPFMFAGDQVKSVRLPESAFRYILEFVESGCVIDSKWEG